MLIFSLCLLLFINAMSIGLVFPIFAPLFTQSAEPLFNPGTALSTQSLLYTMILAIPTIFILLSAPFWGRLSDQAGRKKVLLMGLIGVALSFVLSALGIFWGSLWLLFLSRALAGFMDGSEAVAQAAIADFSSPGDKARNMGLATFAGTIGFIIGPIVGGFLAEPSVTGRFHYEIPFVASLLITLINALVLYLFFPKQQSSLKPISVAKISYIRLLTKGFSICFDKRIFNFSFLVFVLQWCLAAFFQLSTLVLVEKFHYSSGQVGLFTTFLGACFSGGIFLIVHVFLQRVRHSWLLKIGIFLIVVALLTALCLHQSVLWVWIAVVPLMLGIAMMYNVLLSFVSNAVSSAEQGDAIGSVTALKALGWLSSGLLIGLLYPHFVVVLVIMLVVVIFALFSTKWIHPLQVYEK